MGHAPPTRERKVERLRKFLLAHGSPRWQMFAILSITLVAGLLASVGMHWLGLNAMGLRYPLAVGFAYLVFIGLIGLWLSLQRRYSKMRVAQPAQPRRTQSSDGASTVGDLVYYGTDGIDDDTGILPLPLFGGSSSPASSSSSGGGSALKSVGSGDGEGIAILVVVILIVVAVGTALIACAYVIWQAPVLLAEVLVNGGLLAGMARRLRPRDDQHWTVGVIRRTWLPALIVAVTFCAVGFTLEYLVPGAHSLGGAVKKALQ